MKTLLAFLLALTTAALASAYDITLSTGRTIDSEQIKDVAASHAERQFSKDRAGSTNSWEFAWDREIEEPQERSGWVDEWRVSGEVTFKAMASRGGISQPSRRFEAIVRYRDGALKVIDFTAR